MGLIPCIILILILFFKRINIKKLVFIIIFVIIIVFFFRYFKNNMTYLYERILGFESYGDNIRLTMWSELLPFIMKRPFFGNGIHFSNRYLTNIGMDNSHNLYLDIITNHGIFFFIIYLYIFFESIKCSNEKPYLLIMMISFLTPAFFINGLNTTTFWLPLIFINIIGKRNSQDYEYSKDKDAFQNNQIVENNYIDWH